jgi:hypothetical protein
MLDYLPEEARAKYLNPDELVNEAMIRTTCIAIIFTAAHYLSDLDVSRLIIG